MALHHNLYLIRKYYVKTIRVKKEAFYFFIFIFIAEDILWFKPVEIYTKYGRRGNIKEALGT